MHAVPLRCAFSGAPCAAICAHAAHSQALLRDSLRSALRAEPVDLQSVHAIVTLALPGCPVRAHLRAGCRAAPFICADSAPRPRIKIPPHAAARCRRLPRSSRARWMRSCCAPALPPRLLLWQEEKKGTRPQLPDRSRCRLRCALLPGPAAPPRRRWVRPPARRSSARAPRGASPLTRRVPSGAARRPQPLLLTSRSSPASTPMPRLWRRCRPEPPPPWLQR